MPFGSGERGAAVATRPWPDIAAALGLMILTDQEDREGVTKALLDNDGAKEFNRQT